MQPERLLQQPGSLSCDPWDHPRDHACPQTPLWKALQSLRSRTGHFPDRSIRGGSQVLCGVSRASPIRWLKDTEKVSGRKPPSSITAGPGRSGSSSINGLILDVELGAVNRQQRAWRVHVPPSCHTPGEHLPGAPCFPCFSCHTNYNHSIIPEQPPRCAVLFIGKQTGSHSPDMLLWGIHKAKDQLVVGSCRTEDGLPVVPGGGLGGPLICPSPHSAPL